jgi:predicted NAD/FAD-binding protein
MKIAIVGGGISGLAAAYHLQSDHDVTLFEANGYLGGHTNTVDVEINGERHAIDTGFIVFNDWTYPDFVRLLDELRVASQPTEMSFSVCCPRTGFEYGSSTLDSLFANRLNAVRPGFYRMLADIARFNRTAMRKVLGNKDSAIYHNATVGDYLARERYSRQFAEHYLMPMGSAIWSCPTGKFAEFPIRFIVEFYQNHGLLNFVWRPTWRTITGGSRTYVNSILRRFTGRVRPNTPVSRIRRLPDGVEVTPRDGAWECFDHVVLACHADQALRMLADASATERTLLAAFPYERNTATLHTDVRLLPRRRRAWSSWNYRLSFDRAASASVTYCMNILQRLRSKHTFCVSLNCDAEIEPSRVLGQYCYAHPVFTLERAAAQSRHDELIDVNRTSFCGAYWGNGFHEDGVVSALRVCRKLTPSKEKTGPLVSNAVEPTTDYRNASHSVRSREAFMRHP